MNIPCPVCKEGTVDYNTEITCKCDTCHAMFEVEPALHRSIRSWKETRMIVDKHIEDADLSLKGLDMSLPHHKRQAIGTVVNADTGHVYGRRKARDISQSTGICRVSIYGRYRSACLSVLSLTFPDGTSSVGTVILVKGLY